jgi:hypothetical protein
LTGKSTGRLKLHRGDLAPLAGLIAFERAPQNPRSTDAPFR